MVIWVNLLFGALFGFFFFFLRKALFGLIQAHPLLILLFVMSCEVHMIRID